MSASAVAEGNCVVEIAADGRPITPGEATRHIAAAHKLRQLSRLRVAALRRGITGMDKRHQLRRLRQLLDEFGRNQPVGIDGGPRGVARPSMVAWSAIT
jgi:hypothetical protein